MTPCMYPPVLKEGEQALAQGDAAGIAFWRFVSGYAMGVLLSAALYYALYRMMMFLTELTTIASVLVIGSFLLLQFLVFGLMSMHPDSSRYRRFMRTDRAIFCDYGWRLKVEEINRVPGFGHVIEDLHGSIFQLPGWMARRRLRNTLKGLMP